MCYTGHCLYENDNGDCGLAWDATEYPADAGCLAEQLIDQAEQAAMTAPAPRTWEQRLFVNDQVPAASVADFLNRYYKPERYHGRGAEYAAILLAAYEEDFAREGYVIISHHDNVTGKIVAYFGPEA